MVDGEGLLRAYKRGVKKALKEIYEAGEEGFFDLADDFENRKVPVYEKYINPLEKKGVPSFPFTTGIAGITMVMVGLFLYSLLVPPATDYIQFRVVDTQQQPIAGALVQVNDAFTKRVELYDYSEKTGRVAFSEVPALKQLTYAAFKPGYERKSAAISQGQNIITIVMRCLSADCNREGEIRFSPLNVCQDGTNIGECSEKRKPFRCTKSGVLVPDESCGCGSGFIYREGTCVPEQGCGFFCPDGTLLGACSTSKPFECSGDLTLEQNPSKCGCPAGFTLIGDACKPDRSQSDCPGGLPRLSCSPTQPYFCNRDGNIETRSDFCGCPVDFVPEGNTCKPFDAGEESRCADGTERGQCSESKPYYCTEDLTLVPRESCGCGPNYKFVDNKCVKQQGPTSCSDGTPFGTCSRNQPYRCSETGVLEKAASACGCPDGFERDEKTDSCVRSEGTYFCEDGTQSTTCSTDNLFFCDATCTLQYAPTTCACTPNLALLFYHPSFAFQTITIKSDYGTIISTVPEIYPGRPSEWPVILYVATDGTLYYGDDAHDGTGNRLNFEQAATAAHRVDPNKPVDSKPAIMTRVFDALSTRGDVTGDLRQGEIYLSYSINARSGSRSLPGNHFGYIDRKNEFVILGCTDNQCNTKPLDECQIIGTPTPTPTPTPCPDCISPTPTPTPPPLCGNGACVASDGESCLTCPQDCGVCQVGSTGDVEAIVTECNAEAPIKNAQVYVDGIRGQTNDEGIALIEQVPVGRKPIEAFAPYYDAYLGAILVNEEGITYTSICLNKQTVNDPRGNVEATVTSCADDKIIEKARVYAGGVGQVTDTNGKALLTNVPVGQQDVQAFANDFENYEGQIEVRDKQTTRTNFCMTPVLRNTPGDCSATELVVYAYASQTKPQVLSVETELGRLAVTLPAFTHYGGEKPIVFYVDTNGKTYAANGNGNGKRLSFKEATASGTGIGRQSPIAYSSKFVYNLESSLNEFTRRNTPVLYLGWGFSTKSGSDEFPANAFGYLSAAGSYIPTGCKVNDWQTCLLGKTMPREVVDTTCQDRSSGYASYPIKIKGKIDGPSVPDACSDGTQVGQCSNK